MITGINICNLLPFDGESFVGVAQVTLVAGNNGAGKSRLLRAVAQAAEAMDGSEKTGVAPAPESYSGVIIPIGDNDNSLLQVGADGQYRFTPNMQTEPGEWSWDVPHTCRSLPKVYTVQEQAPQAPGERELVAEFIATAPKGLELDFTGDRPLRVLRPLAGRDRILFIEQIDAGIDIYHASRLADAMVASAARGNQVIAEVSNVDEITMRFSHLIETHQIKSDLVCKLVVKDGKISGRPLNLVDEDISSRALNDMLSR